MTALTQALAPEIKRPWHHAVIELMIAHPELKQGEIARRLGKSQTWLSIVVNSDAFRMKLAERREEVVDPVLEAKVEDRLRAVANEATEVLLERLQLAGESMSTRDLTRLVEVSTKGLGMGRPEAVTAQQNNLYFVASPAPAASRAVWEAAVAEAHAPQGEIHSIAPATVTATRAAAPSLWPPV